MQRRSGTVATAVAILTIAGCGIAAEDMGGGEVAGAPAGATPYVGDGGCQDVICGMNSPVVDSFGFHELNLDGAPNAEGFQIDTGTRGVAQIFQGGVWYDLRVSNNHVSGVNGIRVLPPAAVSGAQIPLVRKGQSYVLRVSAARDLPFFVGASGQVGAYEFEWTAGTVSENAKFTNLCGDIKGLLQYINDQGKDSRYAQQELMGLTPVEAVAFEGDRVDAKAMLMDPAADDRWFNFGCAGQTLSKLLLTHNTVHTQDPALSSSAAWQHRQTTLKMLAADYCGTGQPFTVGGQILDWKGDAMTYYWPGPRELEARWNEKGATCIGTPRLMHPTTPQGAALFKPDYADVNEAIAKLCATPPPRCKDSDPVPFNGAIRVTANP